MWKTDFHPFEFISKQPCNRAFTYMNMSTHVCTAVETEIFIWPENYLLYWLHDLSQNDILYSLKYVAAFQN